MDRSTSPGPRDARSGRMGLIDVPVGRCDLMTIAPYCGLEKAWYSSHFAAARGTDDTPDPPWRYANWTQQEGPPSTLEFALTGDPEAVVELWLPHAAVVDLLRVRLDEGAAMLPARPSGPRWIHYGSSISHCVEALRPTETWPAVVAKHKGWDLQNLSLAGQCMLDPFVARLIRAARADAISLKVGINILNGDTFRERTFVPALHGFLDTIRDGHPETPLVLISPIICPNAEDVVGPTRTDAEGTTALASSPTADLCLSRIRQLVHEVGHDRNDPHLHVIDGRDLVGTDDVADLYDGLHPSPAGYLRIADRFLRLLCGPEQFLGHLASRG